MALFSQPTPALTTVHRLALPFVLVALALAPSAACSQPPIVARTAADTVPPPISREFRAVWVATVGNMDWPSRPGLSTEQQQAEMIALLDRLAALRMNAVVLQIRPAADALYQSSIEPWSDVLTGEMGRAPEPFYDPLAFAVAEAHKRGLELHAWINPYRAKNTSTKTMSAGHISRTHPELVRKYGSFLWMDPGDPAVRTITTNVVIDLVRRYDIDGVHMDDYFYPYPETQNGRELDFPDDATWERYQRSGGTLSRDDWRRQNVDLLVQGLGDSIHAIKPWVRYGVSPFGIWRPGYPASVRGFDQYAKLYADARKWLNEGWVD
ncbi:MAG: glycoside hydrolase family 10 protein, partial [Gemmatimonadaceae bacterium]